MSDVTRGIVDVLDRLGESRGSFERVGPAHAALFVDESQKVLLVTFERLDLMAIRGMTAPFGLSVADRHNWSHLCLLARRETSWRDPAVYGYFDRLVDDGFFEDFDRVVFYGAGLAGYAAAAYSVAAPGATVVVLSPRATLDTARAAWDTRHPRLRRTDFTGRYGYAPEMVEGTLETFVFHDPWETEDAMHASLFQGPHVCNAGLRGVGPDPEATLRSTLALVPIIEAACEGRLTLSLAASLWRARRNHGPWQRKLLERAEERGRPELIKQLCRWVVSRSNSRRFARRLEELETGIRPSDFATG